MDQEKVADEAVQIHKGRGIAMALAIHIACEGDEALKTAVAAILRKRSATTRKPRRPVRQPRRFGVYSPEQIAQYQASRKDIYD